jgi:hypothetical protein
MATSIEIEMYGEKLRVSISYVCIHGDVNIDVYVTLAF